VVFEQVSDEREQARPLREDDDSVVVVLAQLLNEQEEVRHLGAVVGHHFLTGLCVRAEAAS
jgi:hypothetical protein